MNLTTEKLREWVVRYRDATRENDPDSQIKALYDCRDLLLECFEPLVGEVLASDSRHALAFRKLPTYDRNKVLG